MPPLNVVVSSFLQDYQAIVDAEWNILYDKLEKIYQSGAKVVLSKLPIGDVATQYFADRDLFCAGRVQEEDLKRTMMVGKSPDGRFDSFISFCSREMLSNHSTINCNVTSRPAEAPSKPRWEP